MTPKEALEILKDVVNDNTNLWKCERESLKIIENHLKALEIIKHKDVECWYLVRSEDLETYNDYKLKKDGTYFTLTQEEFDFLKEVLEDEDEE